VYLVRLNDKYYKFICHYIIKGISLYITKYML